MPSNLLQICVQALDEISSIVVPTFIVGNDDDTAKQLLALAKKVGTELARDYDWQELSRTATVTTTVAVSSYALEADYERIASDTMWDATQFRHMRGHTTRRQWAAITNSQADPALTYYWRLFGNRIHLDPAPQSVFSFNYEYHSKRYCTDNNGTEQDSWTADTDLPLLPEDLFINGIRYYFSKANNLPYGDAEAEYDGVIASRQGKNTPAEAVNMAASVVPPGGGYERQHNIPDRVDSP